jgi:peptidoglycan/LPS O-acetylase OafA/YrhL
VELFFAMSGLLVTRSLHQCVVRSAPGSVRRSLRDFFTRRVARIWPPYFLVLVLAIGALFTDPAFHTHFTEIRSILWSFPLFIANYLFTHHVPPFSLLIMWSLCFEEQFYVLLMIFYVLGRKHLDRWLIAGIVLSVGARLFFGWTRADWFEPFVMDRQLQWRFDALAWACLIWIWHRPIVAFFAGTPHRLLWQSLFVLGAIAVCLPDPSVPVVRAIWYVALSPVFAVLVAAVAFSPNFLVARALTWWPVVGFVRAVLVALHRISGADPPGCGAVAHAAWRSVSRGFRRCGLGLSQRLQQADPAGRARMVGSSLRA